MKNWIPTLIICAGVSGCSLTHQLGKKSEPLNFPGEYLGIWTGELQLYQEKNSQSQVHMSLYILPINDSLFQWVIEYIDNGQIDRREYELKVLDAQKGHFLIDEKNSIELPMNQYGRRLISWFEIQGQVLVISYELYPDQINFQVDVSGKEPDKYTGGQVIGSDTIPQVGVHYPLISQRAKLQLKHKKTLSMD